MTQLQFCFLLIAVFQVKHFLADFPLQTNYMIQHKTSARWDFFFPLLSHTAVHALFTLAICLYFNPRMWWLALVDLGVHFVMDRVKAAPQLLGRFNDSHTSIFWWCLGFDQMVHHLTDLFTVWMLVHAYNGAI